MTPEIASKYLNLGKRVIMKNRPLILNVASVFIALMGTYAGLAVGSPTLPPVGVSAGVQHDSAKSNSAPRMTTAAHWQKAVNDAQGNWAGGDAALSVGLTDGRSMWLFGDSIVGTTAGRTRTSAAMIRNQVVLSDNTLRAPWRPVGAEAFFPSSGTTWFWPTGALVTDRRPGEDVVHVALARTTRNGGEELGSSSMHFEQVGVDIAEVRVPHGGSPILSSIRPLLTFTDREEKGHDIAWGAAMTIQGDDVVVYGSRSSGVPLEFGKAVFVARTRVQQLADFPTWTFWDGQGWSTASDRAAPIIQPGRHGASTSFSAWYDASDKRWKLVYKRGEFAGDAIVESTAARPQGPFTTKVLTLLPPSSGTDLTYLAYAHPEIPTADGSTIVTFCRNTLDFEKSLSDAWLYRPQFMQFKL